MLRVWTSALMGANIYVYSSVLEMKMKLLFFDDFRLGILKGDNVVDVTSVVEGIPHITPQQLISGLIENFEDCRSTLDAAVAASDGVPVSGVRLRPATPTSVEYRLHGGQLHGRWDSV